MSSKEVLINRLLKQHKENGSVLGVILVGSLAKGYGDEQSDVDLEVVVTEERCDQLEKDAKRIIHTVEYNLIFTTIKRLQRIKEIGMDEEHWAYKGCRILFDRSDTLSRLLREIVEYDQGSRLERLKKYYLSYWNNTLSSMGCIRRGENVSGRIYAAIAMQDLIRLLFNLNHQWAPKLKWVFKELPSLQKKPVNLKARIENILINPNADRQTKLWNEIAAFLREEGHSWVDRPEEILK